MPVQVLVEKFLQRQVLLVTPRRTSTPAAAPASRTSSIDVGTLLLEAAARLLDQVGHDGADHAADDFVNQATIIELRITVAHVNVLRFEQWLFAQLLETDQARAKSVIDIVVVVGDRIGDVRQLRFEARLLAFQEALADVAELSRIAWPSSA